MQETQTQTQEVTAPQPRVITVVSTRGEKKRIENFTGTKWKELEARLKKEGVDLNNMKPVEGIKKHTLEHPEADIPEGNFNLFLMPYKSKSGANNRSELYKEIKDRIESGGDSAKQHFTKDGKNYTQISTADLEALLNSYDGGTDITRGNAEAEKKTKKDKKKVKAQNEAAAIGDLVENVKTHKLSGKELFDEVHSLSVSDKLTIAIDILSDIRNLMKSGSLSVGGSIAGPAEPADIETEEQKKAREEKEAAEQKRKDEEAAEQKRKDEEEKEKQRLKAEADRKQKEEDEALDREMKELAGGFNDVDKRRI